MTGPAPALMPRVLAVVAFVAVAAVATWFVQRLALHVGEPVAGDVGAPDLYMEDFVTTTMGVGGKPWRRVEARYMAHYPETDTKELSEPYIILYREEGEPWHVRSERGWVSADDEVMLLLGPVHIWRNSATGRRVMDIHTEDLRVLPDTDYGETDQPVLITTPTSETRGLGMRAWLAEGRVDLLSRVTTVHEPRRDAH
jgi:lipopolysaccharide export system protein LptC